MSVIRCPQCGRAADGAECLACGYTWPRAAAPAPLAMPAAVTFAGAADTAAPPPRAPARRAPAPAAQHYAPPAQHYAPPAPHAPPPSVAHATPTPPTNPAVDAPTPATWDGIESGAVTSPGPIPGRSLSSWVVGAVPAGSPVERFLRSPFAFLLSGGLSFVVVVGFGSLLLLGGDDPVLRQIDSGKAGSVISEILGVPVTARTPRQYLLLGHAYARNGATPQALEAYREAAKQGGADNRALDYTLAALDHPFAKQPLDVLTDWKSEDVSKRLIELTGAEAWHLRHNALKVLQRRQETTGIIAERVAIVDVMHGPDCDRRREGLHRLESLGRGKAALEAIQTLRDNYKENFCIPLTELDRALISVGKR